MLTSKQLTGQDSGQLIQLPESFAGNKPQLGHPDAIQALLKLQQRAEQAGHAFTVVSSYRSFEQQQSIWDRKFLGKLPVFDRNEAAIDITSLTEIERIRAIMLYSALPGASRHHWGSDFDIFPRAAVDAGYEPQLLESEFSRDGIAADFNVWLADALPGSGFFRPYESFQQGIAAEPWHISYAPVAEPALQQLTLERLQQLFMPKVSGTENLIAGQATVYQHLEALHQQFITNICTEAKLS